jgi:hypothetical protein
MVGSVAGGRVAGTWEAAMTRLADLLEAIRQHPAFPELLEQIRAPRQPRFRSSILDREQAEELKNFTYKSAYLAGRRDQHNQWVALLTGECPKEVE